jgi:hypothetical protein
MKLNLIKFSLVERKLQYILLKIPRKLPVVAKDDSKARVNGQKEKAKERREQKSPTKMLHAIITVQRA